MLKCICVFANILSWLQLCPYVKVYVLPLEIVLHLLTTLKAMLLVLP